MTGHHNGTISALEFATANLDEVGNAIDLERARVNGFNQGLRTAGLGEADSYRIYSSYTDPNNAEYLQAQFIDGQWQVSSHAIGTGWERPVVQTDQMSDLVLRTRNDQPYCAAHRRSAGSMTTAVMWDDLHDTETYTFSVGGHEAEVKFDYDDGTITLGNYTFAAYDGEWSLQTQPKAVLVSD